MPSPMRQAIARHMTYSKQNIPHYYLTMRAEISAALDWREEYNAGRAKEEEITVNDLVVKAISLGLAAHPEFNGYYQDGEYRPQPAINLGIAIALPDGLVAPAVLDCRELPLTELHLRLRDLAARTRQGTLRAEEYTAATFTVTNLGMYGVESFAAIIVPPQVGIIAVGSIGEVLTSREGDLIVERRLALTLSGDHRATDGAEGAHFLGDIVTWLQQPEKLYG